MPPDGVNPGITLQAECRAEGRLAMRRDEERLQR